MRLSQALLCSALCLLAGSAGAQHGFDDKNIALVGDFNSDGLNDIYLKYDPQLALIDLDGLMIPVPLSRSRVQEFVLLQQANTSFTIQSNLSDAQKGIVRRWQRSAIEIILGDFDVDFAGDVILKNVASAIPGVDDLFVFGSPTAGAAPAAVRYANQYFKKTVRDFVSGLTNPHYFDSARRSRCESYPAALVPPPTDPGWFEGSRGDEEGSGYIGGEFDYRYGGYLWTTNFVTYTRCYDYIDTTNFSATAIDLLFYLEPYWGERGIRPQTPDANGLETLMEQFFGRDFMRNVLSTNSTVDHASLNTIINTSDINDPNNRADMIDNVRISLVIWRAIRRMTLATYCDVLSADNSGSHFYSFVAPVCTVGSNNCTEQDVYHRESRMHPAPGYWNNQSPVVDGQTGIATLGCSPRGAATCDPFAVMDGGPIKFRVFGYSPGNGGEHWNETLPGHLFHPGRVERKVFTDSNQIVIRTIGSGDGLCPKMNESQGKKLFVLLNKFIACHLRGECHKQHL